MFGAPKADYDFPVRVAQVSWEMMRQVAQDRLAPFTRARDVRLMRPLAIGLASSVRWHLALQTVREVVDNSDIDVVAVSWGPQAKPLVADVACRGTQAIDVGRLLWELHGNSAMGGPAAVSSAMGLCLGFWPPNLYFLGSLLYLIGSISYTLASASALLANFAHVGNICFVCGSILFVIDGRNGATKTSITTGSSELRLRSLRATAKTCTAAGTAAVVDV
eukprot:g17457.t1